MTKHAIPALMRAGKTPAVSLTAREVVHAPN
jgi:hypothetical protein